VKGMKKSNKNNYMKTTDWNIDKGEWQLEKGKTGK
jgi:hypothetical protein